jgi:hypothetical protein
MECKMTDDEHRCRPDPDPTVLTEARIERASQAHRDYVDGQIGILAERLDAIDKATSLLAETVNRVPTEVVKEITSHAKVVDERFESIKTQFRERDIRSEREARDNKVAVDAAFAAQKESAAKQDESNAKAINKSELATTETINKLAELFRTTTDALADKIDDLKTRVVAMESRGNGVTETRQETRAVHGANVNLFSVIASTVVGMFLIIGAVVAVVVAIHG